MESNAMAAENPLGGDEGKGQQGPLTRMAYLLGGTGLLAATAADSLAVTGRHTGFQVLGSIELVQASVVLLAVSAMLVATITGNHAAVHIVTNRLAPSRTTMLRRIAAFISGLVFLALAAGSAWILIELWNGHEQTELIKIPMRWLRLLWTVFALLVAIQFFRRGFKGTQS
jgi:TRAP-type C4-dicarboxylate transport system permease small subunit